MSKKKRRKEEIAFLRAEVARLKRREPTTVRLYRGSALGGDRLLYALAVENGLYETVDFVYPVGVSKIVVT